MPSTLSGGQQPFRQVVGQVLSQPNIWSQKKMICFRVCTWDSGSAIWRALLLLWESCDAKLVLVATVCPPGSWGGLQGDLHLQLARTETPCSGSCSDCTRPFLSENHKVTCIKLRFWVVSAMCFMQRICPLENSDQPGRLLSGNWFKNVKYLT